MKTFPLNFRLKGLPILVVGAGSVAQEKVEKLLPYEPDILVVSPECNDYFKKVIAENKVQYIADVYENKYLIGMRFIIAATNQNEVHETIFREAHEAGIFINTVDQPNLCDFIFPALVQSKHFSLSISTNGKAAGIAKQIREELEKHLQAEDTVLEVIAALRTVFKKKYATFAERRKRLLDILHSVEQEVDKE